MKSIIHGRCKYNGCKARAYADELCYKHFMQKQENEKDDESDENEKCAVRAFDMTVKVIAVVSVVMLWLAISAGAVMFGIYCYRCIKTDSWKIIIISAVLIALAYSVLSLLLAVFDRYRISRYVFIVLMTVFTIWAASCWADLYTACMDCIESWAYAFAESMKGILF